MDARKPPYTYKGKSAWEYKPYLGKGVARPTHRLCALDAPMSKVWQEWERIQDKPRDNIKWLLNEYMDSRQFTHKGKTPKSDKTIKEHRRQAVQICSYPLAGKKVFGDVPLKTLTPGKCQRYLDERDKDGAPVAGNREKALIAVAWNWALGRDLVTLPNPWKMTKRNPEVARKHYVNDYDWQTWQQWVIDNRPKSQYLWIVPEIMYLCRMRKIEVLTATKSQVLGEGFETLRRKGSKDAITAWSPRLRVAIDAALALELDKGMDSTFLIHNKRGEPYKESSFNSGWQRNIKKCIEQTGVKRFWPHLSKHKGTSDSDMSATEATGNTQAAADIYDLSKIKATPTR